MNSPGKPEKITKKSLELQYSEKMELYYFCQTEIDYFGDIISDAGTRYLYSQLFSTINQAHDCKETGLLILTKKHY